MTLLICTSFYLLTTVRYEAIVLTNKSKDHGYLLPGNSLKQYRRTSEELLIEENDDN